MQGWFDIHKSVRRAQHTPQRLFPELPCSARWLGWLDQESGLGTHPPCTVSDVRAGSACLLASVFPTLRPCEMPFASGSWGGGGGGGLTLILSTYVNLSPVLSVLLLLDPGAQASSRRPSAPYSGHRP